jgi:sugar-specific transcriptional regulator TrmB
MDVSILEKIGLTKGEIKAYLALLKLGASSTGPIAKSSGVSRSKLYTIIDKLEEKGLASHVDRHGVRYYHAVEPSKIKDYLQEKEDELKKLEAEFEDFLPELQSYYQEKPEGHKINVYQGFKGHKVAHEHSYHKLKRGDEYYVFGVPHVPDWEHLRYWRKDHDRREEAGISCKMLFNHDAPKKLLMNRNSYKTCEARYMPTDVMAPSYFTVFADTTMITIPGDETVTVEIVSKEITKSYLEYFRELWKRAKAFK